MQRDVDNLLSALEAVQVQGAFLPVVAPTSISVDHTNEYYSSHEAYLEAVADALHEEYKTITDAGLIVQLDDAILTHWWDRITDEGGDYRKWVAASVEIINHALRGIPREQVRYHVCCVISHAISHVEHPELIAQRLRRFADLLGRENVIASSDCGFAQGAGTQRQVPSIMWAKLHSLADGARLASRQPARV